MRQILLLFLVLATFSMQAQSVAIKKIEVAGDEIVVYYDLDDSNPANEYQLSLYASRDNYSSALTKVTGDIGNEVKPGTDKKVRWNAREELGNYKGRLALEIRGKVYLPFVKLQGFDADKSYKRGKSYNLNWKSGNTNPIHIEVYKGGQRIAGEMNQPNNGNHTFYLPAGVKPGSDYRIKISDAKQSDEVLFTPTFKVKPKIPFLFKILPVAALAGGLVFLAGGEGGGGGPVAPPANEIPDPDFPRN
jgi:hypothetical protein